MKKHLKIVIDNSMDATAVNLDCQEHVRVAKIHDERGDERLARLKDHLTIKNDMAGLSILTNYMADEEAEDRHIYGAEAVEYKLVKAHGYVTTISRIGEHCIRLLRRQKDADQHAA